MFFHLKRPSANAKDVDTELVQVLGSDISAYSTVTKYIRNDAIWQHEPEAEDGTEDQDFSIPDNAILEALEIMPFASIRQIVEMIFIPPTTVFRRWTKSIHIILKRLRWVPHRPSNLLKQARGTMSKQLWKMLESMRHHSWKYIVTLDKA
jgi:hypothetical protein